MKQVKIVRDIVLFPVIIIGWCLMFIAAWLIYFIDGVLAKKKNDAAH